MQRRATIIPILENLEPRLLFSTTVESEVGDFGDSFTSATSIEVDAQAGGDVSGCIDSLYDRDFFSFVAPVTGGLRVDMQADDSSLNSYLVAYNSYGGVLAANNDVAWGNVDSHLSFRIKAGESYYILSLAVGGTWGDYNLSFDLSADEYGNSLPQATEVQLNQADPITITSGIDYRYDYDFVKFVAPITGGLRVEMQAHDDGLDSYLVAYNSYWGCVAANNNANLQTKDSRVSFYVEAGNTYYLLALGIYGGDGTYDLNFQINPDESGGSFAQAQEIELNAEDTTVLSGGIDYIYDHDFIKFTAPVTGGLSVEMQATDAGLDSYLLAYNTYYGCVAANNNANLQTTDSRVSFMVEAGKTYYIRAFGLGVSEGDYNLTFNLRPDEGGSSFSQTQDIELNTEDTTVISGGIDYIYDHDFIKFTAPVTGGLSVEMQATDAGLDSYLLAYNTYYGCVAANNNADLQTTDSRVSFMVEAGKTYYIRAFGLGVSEGDYNLTFNLRPDEDGNTISQATEVQLAPGEATVIAAGIDYIYDTDVFSFTASATGGVYAEMQATEAGMDSFLVVRNRYGGCIAANNDLSAGTKDAGVTFYVQAGQTYYVQTFALGYTDGDYNLSLAISADEYGSSPATAGFVELDENAAAAVDSSIDYNGDVDVLAFTAGYSAEMTVTMTNTSGNHLLPWMYLYDSQGRFLNWSASRQGEAAGISFEADAGQSYYIQAFNGNWYTTGSYHVDITTDVPAPPPEPDPLPDPDPDPPAPGEAVTAEAVYYQGQLALRVVGTDVDDMITLSQAGETITLAAGGGTYSYSGAFSSVHIYGFGGNDTIRTTYSLSVGAVIYAGDGNDTIYENGSGDSVLYGGEGDDLLVTIGGGVDYIYGQGGLDSFWFDSGDTVSDASPAEDSAHTLHRVTSFYQPYTTNPASGDYIPLAIDAQNFRDPTVTGYAVGYSDFSSRAVFEDGPQYNDIKQGAVGDCYYLAALASLADSDPQIIRQMVTSLGDGTYAVRFYRNAQEVYLRLDADLPVSSSGSLAYAKMSGQNEIWAPLVEKAYAHFRYGQNSYASISGGWMDSVYREVTNGLAAWRYTFGSLTSLADYIRDGLASGHAITLGSYTDADAPVVGCHAYMIKSIDDNNNVTVYNPWGVDGRSWDSNYYDGLLSLSIQQIQTNYLAVVTALV